MKLDPGYGEMLAVQASVVSRNMDGAGLVYYYSLYLLSGNIGTSWRTRLRQRPESKFFAVYSSLSD